MAMLKLRLFDERTANLIFLSDKKAMRFMQEFEERGSFNEWNAWYLSCELFYYGIEWLPFEKYHKAISEQYWAEASMTLGIDNDSRWFDADKQSKTERYELLSRIGLYMAEDFNNLYFAEAEYISPAAISASLPDDMDYDTTIFYTGINLFHGDLFDPASCREASARTIDYCVDHKLVLRPSQIGWQRKLSFLSYRETCSLLKTFGEKPSRTRAENINILQKICKIDPDKQRTALQNVGQMESFQFLPPAPFSLIDFIDAKSIAWAMAWTLKCFEFGDYKLRDPVANEILSGR